MPNPPQTGVAFPLLPPEPKPQPVPTALPPDVSRGTPQPASDALLVTGRRMKMLKSAYPEVGNDPAVLYQIAQNPGTDEEMLKNVGSMVGIGRMQIAVKTLQGFPTSNQRDQWEMMPTERKAALVYAGYQPPAKRHTGFFDAKLPLVHTQLSGPLKVVAAPFTSIASQIKAVGNVVLPAMNAAQDTTLRIRNADQAYDAGRDPNGGRQATLLEQDEAVASLNRAVASGAVPATLRTKLLATKQILPAAATAASLNSNNVSAYNVRGETAADYYPKLVEWYRQESDPAQPPGWTTYKAYQGDYSQAFAMSGRKERLFRPEAERRARTILDDDEGNIFLAKQAAAAGNTGKVLVDTLKKQGFTPGTPEYFAEATRLETIMSDDDFTHAVTLLASHRVSPGSDLAQSMVNSGWFKEGSTAAGRVVMVGDISFMFATDPVTPVFKGLNAIKIARNFADAESLITKIEETQAIRNGTASLQHLNPIARADMEARVASRYRAADLLADGFTGRRTFDEIFQIAPNLEKHAAFLRAEHATKNIRTGDDVMEAWKLQAGVSDLARTGMQVAHTDSLIQIPALSTPAFARGEAFNWARNKIAAATELDTSGVVGKANLLLKTPARLFEAVATQQPLEKYVSLNDVPSMRRALKVGVFTGVPLAERRRVLDQMIRGVSWATEHVDETGKVITEYRVNEGVARDAWRSFYEQVAANTGISSTSTKPEAQALWARMMDRKFAVNNIDAYMSPSGLETAAGVYPFSDHADMIQIASMHEIQKAADNGVWLQRTYGLVNHRWIESFMSAAWKPLALIRGGFIIRNAGEEVLRFVLTEGPQAYARSLVAESVAKGELAAEIPQLKKVALNAAANFTAGTGTERAMIEAQHALEQAETTRVLTWMRPFLGAVDRATGAERYLYKGRFPAGTLPARNRVLKPIDQLAHWVAANLTDGFRYGEQFIVDPDSLHAARTLLSNARAQHAYAESVAGHQALQSEYVEDVQRQLSGQSGVGSGPVTVKARFARSKYVESSMMHGDPHADLAWAVELEKGHNDPTFGPIRTATEGAVGPLLQRELETSLANSHWATSSTSTATAPVRAKADEMIVNLRLTMRDEADAADKAISDAHETYGHLVGQAPKDPSEPLRDLFHDRLSSVARPGNIKETARTAIIKATSGTTDANAVDRVMSHTKYSHGHAAGQIQNRIAQLETFATKLQAADPAMAVALRSYAERFKQFEIETSHGVLSARAREMILGDAKPRLATGSEIRRFARDKMVQKVQEPVVSRWAVQSDHMFSSNGVPLAEMASEGMQGIYVPHASRAVADEVQRQIASGQLQQTMNMWVSNRALPSQMRQAMQIATISDANVLRIQQIIDPANQERMSAAYALIDSAGKGMFPLSSVGYSSYHDAEEVSRLLHDMVGVRPPRLQPLVNWADVRNPLGSSLGLAERGTGGIVPKTFVPAELDVKHLGRVGFADTYHVPNSVIADMQTVDTHGATVDLGNGRVVPGQTRQQMFEDYADKILDRHLNNYLTKSGEIRHELLQPILRDANPMWHVRSVPEHDLPRSVIVNSLYLDPDAETLMRRIKNRGFDALGAGVNAISRHPLFVHYYAEGLKTSEALVANLAERSPIQQAFRSTIEDLNVRHTLAAPVTTQDMWGFWDDIMADRSPVAGAIPLRHFETELAKHFTDPVTGAPLLALKDGEARALRDGLAEAQHLRQMGNDLALDRAVASMTPFIDDHRERSYVSQYVRGAVPFLYAEEQFLKRWGRVMLRSPEAFHRAQLYVAAGQRVGFIKQNDKGEDVLVMPGFPAAVRFLMDTPVVSDALFQGRVSFPVSGQLSGRLKDMVAGAAQPGSVSMSPVFSIGMGVIKTLFPETSSIDQDLYGPRSKEAVWERFLPAYMKKAIRALAQTDEAYIDRAAIQAAQILEATHQKLSSEAKSAEAAGNTNQALKLRAEAAKYTVNGEPDPANPGMFLPPNEHQIEHWQDEVRRYARALLFGQAVFQFAGPTGGKITAPNGLHPEFIKELKLHASYPEALAEFLRKNPYADAYTIFASESESGARANYTTEARLWVDANKDYAKKHPLAGAWFMPQGKETDQPDYVAMQQQYALGMRHSRTPKEWYEALKVAEASRPYYAERDRRDAALDLYSKENGGTAADRKRIRALFQDFADGYMKQFPIFEKWTNSAPAKNRRQKVREDITASIEAGVLPPTEQAQLIGQITQEFAEYDTAYRQANRGWDSTKVVKANRKWMIEQFQGFGAKMMSDHPETSAFWESVIVPDAHFSQDG